MPNGEDRNWIRLCAAIDGFRSRHQRWPTRVRLDPGLLANLRDYVLSEESFSRLEEKLLLIVEDDAWFVAEDEAGRSYAYGESGFPSDLEDVRALDWLGIDSRPDARYGGRF